MSRLNSKIFIDGGSPAETSKANHAFQSHFGYPLDGQTTNPSLIARNLKSRMEQEGKTDVLTPEMAIAEYKKIVQEISAIIPHGSISIQVFANDKTSAEEMLSQARERATWIPNASIKLPCTKEGLKAAQVACREMPINITLVFSQSQAAAVYEATKQAEFPVFLSPFVGRLDDNGKSGMCVIANILEMYKAGDGHVQVLVASIRNIDHILYALKLRAPILTIPYKVFHLWEQAGFPLPQESYHYKTTLLPIPYDFNLTLDRPWQEYNLAHELTDKGLAAFWADWLSLFSASK